MKKVIYILNLLFLTLSVFGGSVFAADPPTQYVLANGKVDEIPDDSVEALTGVPLGSAATQAMKSGWYYIDGTSPLNVPAHNAIAVGANQNVNIVVSGQQSITIPADSVFIVPEGATLNFWAEPDANDTDTGAILNVTGNYQGFVIGNDFNGTSYAGYTTNNFGNITFNSGTYTIGNNTAGPAIGSSTTSGGTITVNQEAEVTALSQNAGTTSIGVTAGQSCNIEVNGGILKALYGTPYNIGQVINVGGEGSLTLDNQGYIVSGVGLTEQTNWNLKSGIVAVGSQTNGKYNWGEQSPWDAYVYGEVTIPTPQGVELEAPINATSKSSGYYGSLTIADGAQLTVGNDGEPADFFVGGTNSSIINNGTVIIDSINQQATDGVIYPYSWNNNSGSTLTVNSDTTLNIWQNGFNNSDTGRVTVEGTLNLYNSAPLTNSGNLTVAQGGKITGLNGSGNVLGAGDVVNNPGGTVTLDGTVILDDDNAISFQNSGTLDIGPIGQVVTTATQSSGAQTGGELTNNVGGTVTSQNPCYFGGEIFSEQLYKLISSLRKQNSSITCLTTVTVHSFTGC